MASAVAYSGIIEPGSDECSLFPCWRMSCWFPIIVSHSSACYAVAANVEQHRKVGGF
jgi:hypothetical protein